MENLFLTAWVASIPGIGPKRFAQLHAHFPDLGKLLKAKGADLTTIGFSENLATRIVNYKYHHHPQEIESFCVEHKIHLIQSPSPLLEISDPPIILYVRGVVPDFSRPALAVVGTRKITSYGEKVTRDLTRELVRAGYTIISGFMYGVDAVAHETAVASGGKTIAVLGYGFGVPYFPRHHEKLAEKIIRSGSCLLTEYPPWLPAQPQNFPRRNRIVSGLSQGVIVTEAAQKSGSLITANLAVDQGRDVFAVPGPIDSIYSEGTKELINMGAKLVTTVGDILEEIQG